MEIVRLFLSADQLNPPGVRYDPTTDTVQTNVGGTWIDTPAADPRTSPGALLPARTGGDPRCDAAANMTAKVKSIVDFFIATGEIAAFVGGIIDIIAIFFPLFGTIAEILWTLGEVLLGLGTTALATAFTTTVYDDLTCYFYCAADANGQLNASGLANVLANVNALQSSTVATAINAIFASLGWVGISNAGATGEETGDCSACTDCNPDWQFFPDATGWTDGHRGRCVAGVWTSEDRAEGASWQSSTEIMMRIQVPGATTVTRVRVEYSKTPGTNQQANSDAIIVDSGNGWYNGTALASVSPGVTHTASPWEWSGSHALNSEITIWMFGAQFSTGGGGGNFGHVQITRIEIDTTSANYVWESCS